MRSLSSLVTLLVVLAQSAGTLAALQFTPAPGYTAIEAWSGANVAHFALERGKYYLYGAEPLGGGQWQNVVRLYDGRETVEIARSPAYATNAYFADAITALGGEVWWAHVQGSPNYYANVLRTTDTAGTRVTTTVLDESQGIQVYSLCTNGQRVFGVGFDATATNVAFFFDDQQQYAVLAEIPGLASGGSGFDPAGSFFAGAYGFDANSYMYEYSAQQVADRVSGAQATPYTPGDAVAVHVVPSNYAAVMESDGYALLGSQYNGGFTGTNPFAYDLSGGTTASLGTLAGAPTTVCTDLYSVRGDVVFLAKNSWTNGDQVVIYRLEPDENYYVTEVIAYEPAPGQFVQEPNYSEPNAALGWPAGGDPNAPDNSSLVTLGGFGGRITLAFDRTVWDDPANPFGLDAIVYGNAFWVSGDPERKWTEAAVLEISRDLNFNGIADDAWYVIPGSHINTPGFPAQYEVQTWDDDVNDPTHPPPDASWIPPGYGGVWTSEGYHLPPEIFESFVTQNPGSGGAEGVFGYADCSPTVRCPLGMTNEQHYTRPDNPFKVGLTEGSAGGDGFDVAWAVDPNTWALAALDGFDFLRITTGVNTVILNPPVFEKSPEIDAAVDVAEGRFGDTENDGDIDADDFALLEQALLGPGGPYASSPWRVLDFDQDDDLDLHDLSRFQTEFGRP